ncbi:MAG: NADAR family protein [Bacteroidales bacterium]|nr:NADAR family protein [Bacteroidales bacterium]
MSKYTREWLAKLAAWGDEPDFLFFWGHTPKKNEYVGSFCFSQWFPAPFRVDKIIYQTAEHWMMAEKARLFNDPETEKKIVESKNPGQAKEYGREIKNFDEPLWNEKRFEIVVKGNYFKFLQNEDLKNYLLSTKDKVLVEASPVDTIWGIGLTKDSKEAQVPAEWRGLNLLGFALMEVRDRINILEESCQFNPEKNTVVLYRPVGEKELELIKRSDWKTFPPRLPEQPIFYPVLNEEYAVEISKQWNVPDKGTGYVIRFELDKTYFQKFEIHNVGSFIHNEIWVPADQLEEFSRNINGRIEVIKEFKK